MIVAYCDHCGEQIDPATPAGVRYVLGKREYSGHLHEECQDHLLDQIEKWHTRHALRVVR